MIRLAVAAALALAGGADAGAGDHADFMRRSKAGEAELLLLDLADRVDAYHARTGALPGEPAGPTPALGLCCRRGGTCLPAERPWTAPTWRALGMRIHQPHRYSVEYRPRADGYTLLATGDLDCDGVRSTFTLSRSRRSLDSGEPAAEYEIIGERELE